MFGKHFGSKNRVVQHPDVRRTRTRTRRTSEAPTDIRRTACRPPLHPAVGTSGRHGKWPLRPAVGVAVGQPFARPIVGHRTIAKSLQNQAIRPAIR
jgi:hypothetical protein